LGDSGWKRDILKRKEERLELGKGTYEKLRRRSGKKV
jgi:hypothetical protein